MAQTSPDTTQGIPRSTRRLPTNSFEAFRDLIESDAFYAVRLFALRGGDGNPGGDCRVNGDNWEKGAQAMRGYASARPAADTSSTSKTWCYKPWSTAPGQPRKKLKDFLLQGGVTIASRAVIELSERPRIVASNGGFSG
jgi:hypothetical protein